VNQACDQLFITANATSRSQLSAHQTAQRSFTVVMTY